MTESNSGLRITGAVAVVFGVLTVFSGATTLSGAVEMGAVVPFVLWFNTFAGGAYVVAGLGLWLGQRWAFLLSLAILAATLFVFAGFGLHVASGGDYEVRTVFALGLRSTVWAVICLVARRTYLKR
ncbi:hypothetical protein [Yoonia sp.]|uniref:hypothetical protein n=1 Tax=Yoonia sp. TaxID=2212373 RepID=UPI0039771CE7